MGSAGSERRAVVVGAGIAGLATGHALRRLGYQVRLLERDGQPRSEGAGLTLWPNALWALQTLGLDDATSRCAMDVAGAATLTPDGRVLTRLPIERLQPTSFFSIGRNGSSGICRSASAIFSLSISIY